MTNDPDTAQKLDELLQAIRGYDDPRRAAGEWKQAYRLLQHTDLPPGRYGGVVGMRDVAGLTALIAELSGADEGDSPQQAPGPAQPGDIDPETCRRALKAFRKRQRLTKLDDESQLGHGPLSKGSSDAFGAIVPPNEWPDEVWQELVRQGKLKYLGHGFYELAGPRNA